MPDIAILAASIDDLEPIRALLIASNLPTAGVDDHWKTFLIARDGASLVACGGAEAYRDAALIRSVAVTPGYRHRGLGRSIVRQLLDRLAARGMRDFYLLTTTAEEFFRKRGFKKIDRAEIHPQLLSSRELQGACPETAICMRLQML